MRRQHRMRRAAIATIVASATMALLAACGGDDGQSVADLDDAVSTGRALSDELGGAAVMASLSPEARDDWERLEWRGDACWYTAPGWTLAVPAGDDLDDPVWAEQVAALDPVVEANGLALFDGPVQTQGLAIATATGPMGLTVELTSQGSISVEQPIDLGEAGCASATLPPDA